MIKFAILVFVAIILYVVWDIYIRGIWYHGTEAIEFSKAFQKTANPLSVQELKDITLFKPHSSLERTPCAVVIRPTEHSRLKGYSLAVSVEKTSISLKYDDVLSWSSVYSMIDNCPCTCPYEKHSRGDTANTLIIYSLSELIQGVKGTKSRYVVWLGDDGSITMSGMVFEHYFCKNPLYPKFLKAIKETVFNQTPQYINLSLDYINYDLINRYGNFIIGNSRNLKDFKKED